MTKYILFLTVLAPCIALSQESSNNMTPLDKAFIEAKNGGKESVFYNAFLSSTIFIPTVNPPEHEQNRRAGENDTISPIIIESNGQHYLMLFDTKERLASWAQREVGFAALPGHAIVEMMRTDLYWALNVGTENVKTFVPDEIKWLKENSGKFQQETVGAGTQVLIGAPKKIPDGLVDALKKNLSKRNTDVKAAYLGQVYYVKEGEKPHLALVFDLQTNDKSIIEAVSKDLAIATKGLLGEGEYIDIMVNNGNGTALEITKAVKPFYTKSSWLSILSR
jgi:hypothetical protein